MREQEAAALHRPESHSHFRYRYAMRCLSTRIYQCLLYLYNIYIWEWIYFCVLFANMRGIFVYVSFCILQFDFMRLLLSVPATLERNSRDSFDCFR